MGISIFSGINIYGRRFKKLTKKLALTVLSLLMLPAILLGQACAPAAKLAQAKPLSFEAVTFTSEHPGFTIQYPKAWITKPFPVESKSVLFVGASEDSAADSFSIFVADSVDDVASALKDGIERLPAFVAENATARIKSVIPVLMADGQTEATELIFTAKVSTYDIWFYCYAFDRDGKTICFVGDTLGGDNSKALIKEIAHTLKSK
jgi:hypothetical protein